MDYPTTMHGTQAGKPLAEALPTEIKHEIFSYLTEDRKSLCSFAHVHRSWTDPAQYELFRRARITSPDCLKSALDILSSERSSHLGVAVGEWILSGKAPGSIAKSWLSAGETPGEWLPDPSLVPHLRSLRLEYWEPPRINPAFFDGMSKLTNLSELHLHNCTFRNTQVFADVLFHAKRIGTLTLSGVKWESLKGDFTPTVSHREHFVPLETLRIRNPRTDYGPLFRWFAKHVVSPRYLEVTMCDPENARHVGWYIQQAGYRLEEFVCGLCLPATDDPWEFDYLNLEDSRMLRTLSFDIYDSQPFYLHWVYKVLSSATVCPLQDVAFSLALRSRASLWSVPWEVIHSLFTTEWKKTLRHVAITHRSDWRFLEDATSAFVDRFPELAKRRKLSVFNVETEDSAATRPPHRRKAS
ncbi:hypothetical protein GY45DRAFT_971179 [Cubamyces sp. BRFM 1775]|nr:hypothetical protein GY45DRAFT_971179 [Cubamyces sp. BRFM 1775]